jgi:hypothetical protein
MPTMVTASRIAVTRWPSANHPAGEKQPHDVAEHPQGTGANVFAAEIFVARHGLVTDAAIIPSLHFWPLIEDVDQLGSLNTS